MTELQTSLNQINQQIKSTASETCPASVGCGWLYWLIDLVQNKNNDIRITLSEYIVQNIHQDYSKLSNLFSNVEGISIEKYFINLKIEKVKELIVYDELSLSEIANLLNYSSVAHLSNQFKKVTSFSPSYFKQIKESKRKELDHL